MQPTVLVVLLAGGAPTRPYARRGFRPLAGSSSRGRRCWRPR